MSSDGIMVDSTSPVSGTVYDGLGKYLCTVYTGTMHYQGYKQKILNFFFEF